MRGCRPDASAGCGWAGESATLSRMAEPLTEKEVRHIAKLARLNLSAAQVELYRTQLSAVLEHVNKLAELDLEDVEPL